MGLWSKQSSSLIIGIANPAFMGIAFNATSTAESRPKQINWTKNSYEPYPLARISDDANRYPKATPSTKIVNHHCKIDHLGRGVFGTHWFVSAAQSNSSPVWHFKTAGDPAKGVVLMIDTFANIGWGQWFRCIMAFVEIGSAKLLWVPRGRRLGAALLAATIGCAALFYLSLLESSVIPAFVLGVLCAFVMYFYRAQLADLTARVAPK